MTAALDDAYRACAGLAAAHGENFPVASRLLPARLRPHVAALYAFARAADDIADEPGLDPGERLRRLDDWRARLFVPGAAPSPGRFLPSGTTPPPDTIFLALSDTIRRFDLPVVLLDDLLSAFRQDVTTTRYESWEEVFDYCRRSANPVGRLLLRLFGYADDRLDRASDAVCTALQLTNFWQDLAIDHSRGRLYVPSVVWRAHGAALADLDAGHLSPAWASALGACAAKTRALFDEGRAVADGVSGRLRWELRATWLGGVRILQRLERGGFDVFASRPTLRRRDLLVIAWGTLCWGRARPLSAG